jgi:hypothetical protein
MPNIRSFKNKQSETTELVWVLWMWLSLYINFSHCTEIMRCCSFLIISVLDQCVQIFIGSSMLLDDQPISSDTNALLKPPQDWLKCPKDLAIQGLIWARQWLNNKSIQLIHCNFISSTTKFKSFTNITPWQPRTS